MGRQSLFAKAATAIVAMKVFLLLPSAPARSTASVPPLMEWAVAVEWTLATAWAEGLDLVEAGVENAAQPRKFGDWERRMESMTSSWTVRWRRLWHGLWNEVYPWWYGPQLWRSQLWREHALYP